MPNLELRIHNLIQFPLQLYEEVTTIIAIFQMKKLRRGSATCPQAPVIGWDPGSAAAATGTLHSVKWEEQDIALFQPQTAVRSNYSQRVSKTHTNSKKQVQDHL